MGSKMKTIIFENHAPIRYNPDSEKNVWIGYAYLNFGGDYVCGVIGRDGKITLWHKHNTAYTDGRSYNHFLARLDKDSESDKVYNLLYSYFGNAEQAGNVMEFLRKNGYCKIETIE